MEDIITSEIIKHNCDGLCSQEYCSDKATRFFKMNINNQKLFIPLCDKHSSIIENANFDECLESPIIECEADKDGIHYKFYCKYCGEYHNHGAGEGHRVSHCTQPSPYKNTGYILKLKNKDLNSKEVLYKEDLIMKRINHE